MLGWTEIKIYLGSLLLDRSLSKFFRQMLHFAAHFVSIRAYCQLCFQKTCLQLLRNVFIAAEPIPAGFSLFQFLVFLKHFSSCHLVAGTKLKVTLFNGFENTALNVLTQRGIFMSIFSIEQLLIFISVSWSAWKCLSFSFILSFAEHIFKFASVLSKNIHNYYICLVRSTRAEIALWN